MRQAKLLLAAASCCFIAPFGASAAETIIDFDDLTTGTPVTALSGVNFSSNVGAFGLGLTVSSVFETRSGSNYLGVDDGLDESFFGGDSLSLDLDSPVSSLSLAVIAVPGLSPGAFTLSGGGQSAVSGAPDAVLSGGLEVFLLSLAPAGGLSAAVLSSVTGAGTAFAVDDIRLGVPQSAIPLPGAMIVFLTGLGAAAAGRRRPLAFRAAPR